MQTTETTLRITNAMIADGSGAPVYRGDLEIRGERITAIYPSQGLSAAGGPQPGSPAAADDVIDAAGRVVSPGFIDPHSHGDLSILRYPHAESKVMQGITTYIGGNCGLSLAPLGSDLVREQATRWFPLQADWSTFGGYLDRVEQSGTAANFVPLVGHNAVRLSVLGADFKRRATADEVARMQAHVAEAMESGAAGFTTGLDASPGEYADVEEIAALARIAGAAGGIYATHVRHNQTQWPADSQEEYAYGLFHGPLEDVWVGRFRGYAEAVEVGRRAGIPVHISHLAYAYVIPQPHPDFLAAAVARATLEEFIDKPRREGVQVTFDTIFSPSGVASAAPLLTAFKRQLDALGRETLLAELRTESFRNELRTAYDIGKLKFGFLHPKADPFWAECFKLMTSRNPDHQGRLISDLIAELGGHPVDALAGLILEDPDAVWGQVKDKKRTPPGLAAFLEHPLCMPCTDAFIHPAAPPESDPKPPPIAYGNYPAFFDYYVREKQVVSLEGAVHRATQVPARAFGLTDRGELRPGAFADIVLFEPGAMRMTGDALCPERPPEGIAAVLVNGKVVYRDGMHTGELAGKVLRRSARP